MCLLIGKVNGKTEKRRIEIYVNAAGVPLYNIFKQQMDIIYFFYGG